MEMNFVVSGKVYVANAGDSRAGVCIKADKKFKVSHVNIGKP